MEFWEILYIIGVLVLTAFNGVSLFRIVKGWRKRPDIHDWTEASNSQSPPTISSPGRHVWVAGGGVAEEAYVWLDTKLKSLNVKSIILINDGEAAKIAKKWAGANKIPIFYIYPSTGESNRQWFRHAAITANHLMLLHDGHNRFDRSIRSAWIATRGITTLAELITPKRQKRASRQRKSQPVEQSSRRRVLLKGDGNV